MPDTDPAKQTKPQSSERTARKSAKGFTDEERAAMKERSREMKAASRRKGEGRGDGESEVLAKIAQMSEADRAIAERVHAIVTTTAPELSPRTWYGMPAYAKGGKILCHFQSAEKFKSRYATLGFSDQANLDDGAIWPTSFALHELTAAAETRIGDLVKKAVR